MTPEEYIPRSERSNTDLNSYLNEIKRYKENDPASVLVVGVNGARTDGNTARALEVILKRIEKYDKKAVLINLKNVKMTDSDDAYSEDPKSARYPVQFDDDIPDIHEFLLLADGIVLATSTNWGKQTPRMNLFENHLTPLENTDYLLEGKICAFIVTGEESGQIGVIENQMWVTNSMGMISPPYGGMYIISGKPSREHRQTARIQPRWAAADLELAGDNMIKMILTNRFSGVDFDRRRSQEQISRLDALVRNVTFRGNQLEVHLPTDITHQ